MCNNGFSTSQALLCEMRRCCDALCDATLSRTPEACQSRSRTTSPTSPTRTQPQWALLVVQGYYPPGAGNASLLVDDFSGRFCETSSKVPETDPHQYPQSMAGPWQVQDKLLIHPPTHSAGRARPAAPAAGLVRRHPVWISRHPPHITG